VTFHPVRLVGATVILREFTVDDTDAAQAIVGDPAVTDFLSFDAKTWAGTAAMLAGVIDRARAIPRTEYYLAVDAAGELVGFARLGLAGVQAGKLGYAVRADRWGRGYATDAARVLTTFGFDDLGLHRVSAAIGPDNPASIALVERLGFTHEGRLRDHVYTNGAWRDSLLYSVLAHEWKPTT
jgi:[ribosomal protein S5]-alanine N-acetyltransferase